MAGPPYVFISIRLVAVSYVFYKPVWTDVNPDCHNRVHGFVDCVNKTMREKYSLQDKLQAMKARINSCLTRSKCGRLYLDVLESGRSANDAQPGHTQGASRQSALIFQCIKDFREYSRPIVKICVAQLVPNAPVYDGRDNENKWTVMQQARDQRRLQRLCARRGSYSNAVKCIDHVFIPNEPSRKDAEKLFKEFCTAAGQCRVGMGVCRTVLENGRKAHCDCTARVFQQFDNHRKHVPSCRGVSKGMVTSALRMYPVPFMIDCGPDPCDTVMGKKTLYTNITDYDDYDEKR